MISREELTSILYGLLGFAISFFILWRFSRLFLDVADEAARKHSVLMSERKQAKDWQLRTHELPEQLQQLLRRMLKNKILSSLEDLRGCTEPEIALLETKYQLALPSIYRSYLSLMGRFAGRLYRSDHMEALYQQSVLDLTAGIKDNIEERNTPPHFDFPADALIICTRLDDYYWFIRCNQSDDSPVWRFTTRDWQIEMDQPNLQAWFDMNCEVAEHAIASRYFEWIDKNR
jgi:hypothetical protein